MQDYETAEDPSSLEEKSDRVSGILKSMLKRLIAFVCFGPGVLGVLWILGRLFKR